jgi:hypothetical protein
VRAGRAARLTELVVVVSLLVAVWLGVVSSVGVGGNDNDEGDDSDAAATEGSEGSEGMTRV